MKISRLINSELVALDEDLADKEAVIRRCAELFASGGVVERSGDVYRGMMEREEIMSTGVGKGLAVPHAALPGIASAGVLILRLARPVDYQALDGEPVDIVIGMVVPDEKKVFHLQLLAAIARLCKDPDFMGTVRKATDGESLVKALVSLEEGAGFP